MLLEAIRYIETLLFRYINYSLIDLISAKKRMIALNVKETPIDWNLYFRPFTGFSWLCFIITVLIFFTYLKIIKSKFGPTSLSYQWSEFVIWAAFVVVINGYYSGALTMFFASAPIVPFTTEKEGMRQYPKWKMVYPDGSDILIQPLAEAGVPEYVEYWNRLLNDPQIRGELRVPKVMFLT